MAHALYFKRFKIAFGYSLDEFWGRPGKDFDGVVRQQPSNALGFDVETFVRTLKLRVSLTQPVKALKRALLRVIAKKWCPDTAEIVKRLLG
jgi:hypothetical protein